MENVLEILLRINTYLNGTKRLKLKQLLNSQNVEKDLTKSAFQFDKDEVINGMIWSEILAKPKQL